jgi:hypothetical protein
MPANIVVYTASFGPGGYEAISPKIAYPGCDYVFFCDRNYPNSLWSPHKVKRPKGVDPIKFARFLKTMPHKHFEGYDYSLWIDSNCQIHADPRELVRKYLKKHDLTVHRHRHRDCIYDELLACKRLKKDSEGTMTVQLRRYEAEGYPRHNGLVETMAVLRRHTPEINEFNEMWWEEIRAGSRRDQLSFNYCAKKTNLEYGMFTGDVGKSPYFILLRHDDVRKGKWKR